MNQKSASSTVVILIIVGVLVAGGGLYWWLTGGKFTKAGMCYKNLSNLGRSGIPSMPDPAAVFCTCMGGKYDTEKTPTGGEKGLCQIEGKTYGEWEYFCSKNKGDNVYTDCKNYQAKIESDETTNWKTYRNEQYGFEFKYPNNFRYLDNKKSNEALIVVWVDEIADAPFNMNFFQITVSPSIQYPSGISSSCLGAKSFGTIKIGSDTHEKYLLFSERANDFTSLCVNVVHSNYLFEFYADSYSKDGLIIDKILSTFQFTK